MLKIETVKAQISIHTTNARQTIESPHQSFEMNTKQAQILIERDPLRIQIDQSQCFAEEGLMNNETFAADNAARGQQAAAASIDRIVSEGNRLADIQNPADGVAEIAYGNSFDIREYDLGTIPKSKPRIDFVGGKMDIKVDDGFVQINSKPNMPKIDYEAGKVETGLSRYPSISITYVGENVDTSV